MPLSPHLRDRILRQLEGLSDERGYQVLDYVEFVATKHGAAAAPSANIFTRFTEGVEDTMRAGRLSTAAISETVGLLNKAMGVLNGVAAAGKSVASDIVTAASTAAKSATGTTAEVTPPAPPEEPKRPADDEQQPPVPPGL
jgi:hypothetical protein